MPRICQVSAHAEVFQKNGPTQRHTIILYVGTQRFGTSQMPLAKEQELLSMFELNKAEDSTLRIRVSMIKLVFCCRKKLAPCIKIAKGFSMTMTLQGFWELSRILDAQTEIRKLHQKQNNSTSMWVYSSVMLRKAEACGQCFWPTNADASEEHEHCPIQRSLRLAQTRILGRRLG